MNAVEKPEWRKREIDARKVGSVMIRYCSSDEANKLKDALKYVELMHEYENECNRWDKLEDRLQDRQDYAKYADEELKHRERMSKIKFDKEKLVLKFAKDNTYCNFLNVAYDILDSIKRDIEGDMNFFVMGTQEIEGASNE